MTHRWSLDLAVFALSLLGLVAGLAAAWWRQPLAAQWWWTGASMPAVAMLLWTMGHALVRGEFGLDALALLSILGAVALGENLAAAVIATMLASGRLLESFAERRAGREMSALLARVPRTANRYLDGEFRQVPLESVAAGDRLLVRHGEVVPVDGTLTSAAALLDESALTGESLPARRAAGDALASGGLNAAGSFEIVASATSAASTLAGIVKLVEAAQRSKAPASRLADRYALWFIPLTLGLAAAAWLVGGTALRALAVLVVATPCPLILAVPVAIVSGISSCARRGVLVKGGAALERLSLAKILFFDKTGTLTGGHARLVAVEPHGGLSQNELLGLAASLDQMSNHVIAAAVVEAARERGLELRIPGQVQEQAGAGMRGTIDGRQVAIGSLAYISDSVPLPEAAQRLRERAGPEGASLVCVAVDGRYAGALLLADQVRLETPRAMRLLRQVGVERVVMLTGDRHDIAESIGASLGVDEVLAEQAPGAKLAAIEQARHRAVTMMVGDGVNDAPALAAADVGVAMGARGAAASAEAAGVVLLVDRLDRLAEALHIAQGVRRIALQSVITGMGLSLLGMLIAALGYLPPLYGAVTQEVIDVIVIVNALRALRVRPLRASRYSLPPVESRRLQAEHEALGPVLDKLSFLADHLADLPSEEAVSALAELDALLRERLLPHERADDTEVYPALAGLLGGDDPMAAMSRTHREIFRLHQRLSWIVERLTPRGPDAESRRELQRLLYALDAILRLHFAQEEEIYLSLA